MHTHVLCTISFPKQKQNAIFISEPGISDLLSHFEIRIFLNYIPRLRNGFSNKKNVSLVLEKTSLMWKERKKNMRNVFITLHSFWVFGERFEKEMTSKE